MSAARPYHLIAQHRLDRIAADTRAALGILCSRWWPAGATAAVDTTRCDPAGLPESGIGCVLQGGGRWLAVFASEHDWRALPGAWLGCNVGPASPLAQSLTRSFCQELFAALAGAAPEDAAQSGPLRPRELPGIDEPGAGILRCALRLDAIPLTLLAGPALWPAAEAPARPGPELTPCHAALGEARALLRVSLPTVRVPLTDLASLAPGDFLRLGLDLSGSVLLRGENVDLTLPATIGRRGGRKAVQLGPVRAAAETARAPAPFIHPNSVRTPS